MTSVETDAEREEEEEEEQGGGGRASTISIVFHPTIHPRDGGRGGGRDKATEPPGSTGA